MKSLRIGCQLYLYTIIIEQQDVNTYTEWISMFSIILANVIAYVLIAIWLSTDGKNPSLEMKLISAKEEKRISAEFLLSYVLPLMAFDFTVWSSMIIFLFYFVCLGFISIKHNSVSINIGLELVGYSLFECVLCKEDNEGNYSDLQMLTKKNLVNHVGGIIKIKSVNTEKSERVMIYKIGCSFYVLKELILKFKERKRG